MALRILWYSTIPCCGVGYGVATKNLVSRMIADGYYVEIATKHDLPSQLSINGITCFKGTQHDFVNMVQQQEGFDYIISMMDDWVVPPSFTFNSWVNCLFIDTHKIHHKLVTACNKAKHTIAVTKFSEQQAKDSGISSLSYAPLGVDTKVFKPDPDTRQWFRKKQGWSDETFVIGIVGINYINDRKNYINLLKAFKLFHAKHPDSVLYLHTDIKGSSTGGMPLEWILDNMGFPSNGTGCVQFVNQKDYHKWNISEEHIAATYNGMDLFCLPTMGEGFGMPIIEAQACGKPVIVTDTTSGKELVKSGWLIPVKDDCLEFSSSLTWVARVRAPQILEKLELAYDAWKKGKFPQMAKKARKEALKYDWDVIYKKYWKPILQRLEDIKTGKFVQIDEFPNYDTIYSTIDGTIFAEADCEKVEHDKVCERVTFPQLPGEPPLEEKLRPTLMRMYPLFFDDKGEIYVDRTCLASTMIPPAFETKCKDVISELLSYPKIREAVKKLWEDKQLPYGESFGLLKDIPASFDSKYSKVIQGLYETTFAVTEEIFNFIKECDSILDVGCGDGWLVRGLKKRGKNNVIGTEVNPDRIDGTDVVYGDITSKLPFEDNSFDCVFSVEVLEHVSNPLDAIKELWRVTKKKAVIALTATDTPMFDGDRTHLVKWHSTRWTRELNKYFIIHQKNPYKPDYLLIKRETIEE